MPVIALSSLGLHGPSTSHHGFPFSGSTSTGENAIDARESEEKEERRMSTQPIAFAGPSTTVPSTPNSTTPLTPPSPLTRTHAMIPSGSSHHSEVDNAETDHENEAGPSHHRQSSIPPPASARRHRSGVLMSQARSRKSSAGFPGGGVIGSKSFGDLSVGLQMSSPAAENREDEIEQLAGGRDFRRITSDGFRRTSGDLDDNIWDNR